MLSYKYLSKPGLLLVAPLLILLAVACQTADVPPPAPATSAPAPADAAPADEAPVQEVSSDIANFALEDLVIQAGTTVTWTNQDSATHTTTSGEGSPTGVWDSGNLSGSDSFSFTFNEPGEFAYFCRLHPSTMRATVSVKSQ